MKKSLNNFFTVTERVQLHSANFYGDGQRFHGCLKFLSGGGGGGRGSNCVFLR